MESYPSGKGQVCKTSMQRFDSARLLESDLLLQVAFFETQEGIAFLNCVSFKYFEPPFGGSFFVLKSHVLEARFCAYTKTKKTSNLPARANNE